MAGKSNKGKNRKGAQLTATNSSELPVSTDAPTPAPLNDSSSVSEANGDKPLNESIETKPEVKEQDNASEEQHPAKQGGLTVFSFEVSSWIV